MSKIKLISILILFVSIISCNQEGNKANKENKPPVKKTINIPDFNADSAYYYVDKQVAFGPRVPNSKAHRACASFLVGKLKDFSDTVFIQDYKVRAFDGTVLNSKNIIGSFNPRANSRILLCAHWDSRPFSDHDPDPSKHKTPIDAANDGASGVGVLLEIARQLALQKPSIGVDIILFDSEDYGPPQDSPQHEEADWWGLGSQYWSRNPHKYNYYARYGILLDMVGAKDAKFFMEGFSMNYAPGFLKSVWETAHRLGYKSYFIFEPGNYVDDDHKYINEIMNIPTIDIIQLDPESSNGTFNEYWHTSGDTMDKISSETLKAVGQTLLTVVYEMK